MRALYHPQLDTFVAVVECGSFAKAAQSLYISTTAVIKQINALEERIGLQLLDRTSRGTTLSEVGVLFYQEAKNMIAQSHQTLNRLRTIQQQKEGDVIRIGIGFMTSRKLLWDVIHLAQQELPKLQYQLVSFEMRPELYRQTIARLGKDIDFLLIMYDPMRVSSLNTLHLTYEPVQCAVSLHSPLARKVRLSIQDLYGYNLLCFCQGFNSFIDQFRSDMQEKYPEIQLKDFSYINEDIFNQCANSNDVLFAVPLWQDYHPGIKILPVDWTYTVPFGLRYASDASPLVYRFVQIIKNAWPKTGRCL